MNVNQTFKPNLADQIKSFDQTTHELLQQVISIQNEILASLKTSLDNQNKLIDIQNESLASFKISLDNQSKTLAQLTENVRNTTTTAEQTVAIHQNTSDSAKDVAKLTGALRFTPTAFAIANTAATPIFTAPVG